MSCGAPCLRSVGELPQKATEIKEMDVTHLEVRRHPTWQTELQHSLTVPEYRVLHAERHRRRVLIVGLLRAVAAAMAMS